MKTLALSLVGLLFALPSWSAESHYQYSVRVAGTSASCQADGNALAQKFWGLFPQAHNVSGHCLSTSQLTEGSDVYSLNTLLVNYDADLMAGISSLEFKEDVLVSSNNVFYPTYGACLQSLPGLTQSFSQFAQAQVLTAYCKPEASVVANFTPVIDSVGTLQQRLYGFVDQVSVDGPDSVWQNEVSQRLAQGGAHVVVQNNGHYLYFATYALNLTSQNVIHTYTLAECQSQQAEAAALFSDSRSPATVACHPWLAQYALDVLTNVGAQFGTDFGAGSPVYLSFAECTANIENAKRQASNNGAVLIGAFCSPSEFDNTQTRYQMEIFRQRY